MPPFRFAMIAAAMLSAGQAAQAEPSAPALAVELNAAETAEGSCTLSFLITNALSGDLDQAVFETVLFDQDGQVERLTLFDFGALPQGRPRVRQFVLPELGCDGLGRILFNGAETCNGTGVAPQDCARQLQLTTRTEIEVLG